MKVLLSSFHLKSYTKGFGPQNSVLRTTFNTRHSIVGFPVATSNPSFNLYAFQAALSSF